MELCTMLLERMIPQALAPLSGARGWAVLVVGLLLLR